MITLACFVVTFAMGIAVGLYRRKLRVEVPVQRAIAKNVEIALSPYRVSAPKPPTIYGHCGTCRCCSELDPWDGTCAKCCEVFAYERGFEDRNPFFVRLSEPRYEEQCTLDADGDPKVCGCARCRRSIGQ